MTQKEQQEILIKANRTLTQLRNLSLVMKLLFTPPKKIMEERNCDVEEAVDKLNKAYDFIQKYGVMYLEDAVKELKPVVTDFLCQIITNRNEESQ